MNNADFCPDCGRPIYLNGSGWWTHGMIPEDCWRLSMDGPREGDLAGTVHPAWQLVLTSGGNRFQIVIDGHEPDEEDGWRYKLRFIDRKYQDSDGFPVDAVCAGNSWDEAYKQAGEWIDKALTTDHCIFI